MAIRSLARSGVAGQKYINFLAGNPAFVPSSDFLIQEQILASTATSVTFSSIPQTYKHLQLRVVFKPTTGNATLDGRLNSDSGSNYTRHELGGNGSSVYSQFSTGTEIYQLAYANGGITGYDGFGVVDILDYSSTVKNTTIRSLNARTDGIRLLSSAWLNTAAVTSLTLNASADVLAIGSRFSLYGSNG